MDPVTLGLITMGVGGAIKLGGDLFDDTASRQANLMRQEAQVKNSALEENMRRAEGAQTQVLSSTKARMAGTGFDSSSASFSNYLEGMGAQFAAQNKFTADAGQKSIQLMEQSADLIGDPLKKVFAVAGDVAGTGANIAGVMKPGSAPTPVYGGGAGSLGSSLWDG